MDRVGTSKYFTYFTTIVSIIIKCFSSTLPPGMETKTSRVLYQATWKPAGPGRVSRSSPVYFPDHIHSHNTFQCSALEKTADDSESNRDTEWLETWSCRTGLTFQDAFQRKYAVRPVDWKVAKCPWAWTLGPCFRELIGFWRKRALVSKLRRWGGRRLTTKCQRSLFVLISAKMIHMCRESMFRHVLKLALWSECTREYSGQ